MDNIIIENSVTKLIAIERILLHLSTSEYFVKDNESELFIFLMENIEGIRKSLEKVIE